MTETQIANLVAERDSARALARVLAHSYKHDSRPPPHFVLEALAFEVAPEIDRLLQERSEARVLARILARAYECGKRPNAGDVAAALAFPVRGK